MQSCSNSSSNKNSEITVTDYNKGTSLQTLDSKFAEAQRKIKQMLPIEIDEYMNLTDFQLTDESIIYCCTLNFDGDFSGVDFKEIDEMTENNIRENMASEQMRMMMKYCACSGRDFRYYYYSKSGDLIHKQVLNPYDYINNYEE